VGADLAVEVVDMSAQPEALRLADALMTLFPSREDGERAAAELRRLHAENAAIAAALASSCDEQRHELWESGGVAGCERARVAERQRDALLEALNAMLTHMGMDEDEWNKPTFDQARAAIKAAEETK
jgi:hypothetical protein